MVTEIEALSAMTAGAPAEITVGEEVDRGSDESFPASDAPSWTSVVRTGAPVRLPQRKKATRR